MPRLTSRQYRAYFASPKSDASARGGASAQRHGSNFERLLELQHEQYKAAGLASLMRMNLPTRSVNDPNNPMLRVISGKSGVDFWGVISRGRSEPGIPVVIEAKHTGKEAASLALYVPRKGKSQAGLSTTQLAYLADLAMNFGAKAIVLWENGPRVGIMLPHLVAYWHGAVVAAGLDVQGVASLPFTRTVGKMPTRIPTTAFEWLPPDSVDWLTRVCPPAEKRSAPVRENPPQGLAGERFRVISPQSAKIPLASTSSRR